MFLVYALMDVIKWILDNMTFKVIVVILRKLQLCLTLSLEASVEKQKHFLFKNTLLKKEILADDQAVYNKRNIT